MAQINVKEVPDEVNDALDILAKVFMVNKADVVVRALKDFVTKNQQYVDQGMEMMKTSPLRKG